MMPDPTLELLNHRAPPHGTVLRAGSTARAVSFYDPKQPLLDLLRCRYSHCPEREITSDRAMGLRDWITAILGPASIPNGSGGSTDRALAKGSFRFWLSLRSR